MITKMLVSAAILGSLVAGAAPVSADPSQSGTDPNPFRSLSCNCQETTPADGPALTGELNRGIWKGLSG